MSLISGKLGKHTIGDNSPVRVAGIINLSKASFYSTSIATTTSEIETNIKQMINEGAEYIDIGAQSTRPIQIYGGEGRVDEATEKNQISQAIDIALDIIASYNHVEISIDTMRKNVAEIALNKGIRVINDISGLKKEPDLAKLVADFGAAIILMAAKEEPGDVYLIPDIKKELHQSITLAEKAGIEPHKIAIDPGIGSWEARPYHHDFIIINNLLGFRELSKPLYLGISRKTSIGKVLNDAPASDRLYGSLGATSVSVLYGAHVIRTHDVKPTIEVTRVVEALKFYAKEE